MSRVAPRRSCSWPSSRPSRRWQAQTPSPQAPGPPRHRPRRRRRRRSDAGVPHRRRGAAARRHGARSRRPAGGGPDGRRLPGGSGRQAAQGGDGRVHQAHRPAARRPAPRGPAHDNRVAAAPDYRHLDQRRRRAAGPRHPAAGRSGQHPLRVGPPDHAERAQVRRPPAAQRPARAWSPCPAPASWSTSRPITARCARRCCASPAASRRAAAPLQHQHHRGLRHLPPAATPCSSRR